MQSSFVNLKFGHEVDIEDSQNSSGGVTLVTVTIDGNEFYFTPTEALSIAKELTIRANCAGMLSQPKRIVDKPIWQGYEDK